MIIRVPHRRQFTIIADAALRDGRLSFRATGVLAYLLSLPDGTEVSARRLVQAKSEGRDAILRALDELQAVGYLTRDKQQNTVDGRWTTSVVIRERPSPENPDPENQDPAENQPPSPENPNSGHPDPENQDLKAFSTSDEYLEPTPGNPKPTWADQPMWKDEEGNWFVGPKKDEAAS